MHSSGQINGNRSWAQYQAPSSLDIRETDRGGFRYRKRSYLRFITRFVFQVSPSFHCITLPVAESTHRPPWALQSACLTSSVSAFQWLPLTFPGIVSLNLCARFDYLCHLSSFTSKKIGPFYIYIIIEKRGAQWISNIPIEWRSNNSLHPIFRLELLLRYEIQISD